ncbi:hypothetical protein OsI_15084 [Oryza sativa Indica Group]|uniref:Formin-like protein n=1 Tax=Oryza sativa subsp. indica TaxID=39946 RepID=B8AR82_ORYSI|nr:hypothetical protein OsI_15084 [Oryza sativa Indica Group]
MEQFEYKNYLDNIVLQLREQFVDSSLMVFNFRDEGKSLVSGLFSLYGITVKDYPCQYLGCPLLPLEMVLHFLRLSERWLMLEGQQNFLLMHCEKGGWPVLAFMLAGLLLYMKQYNGEERTLVMVYKQAPKELLQMLTTLNPQPSHLRYLQYICKMDDELEWPIQPIPFTLDCVILREVPNFDGVGGCRPIVRVYGQDFLTVDKRCNVMLPPSKPRKHARRYKQQADNISVKLNVGSCVQGDVVLECLHIDDSLEDERLMFRVMFNTYFIQSHILPLNFENIDVSWDAEQRFTKKFKAEVLFSEFDGESDASTEVASDYDDEVEVGSIDVFFEAVEIFSNLDSQEGQRDAEILSITSTECSPRAELMKTAPFSHFDMEIGLGGSQKNKIDGMVLSLENHSEFDVKELESLFAIAPKTKGGSKSDGASKSLGSKPDKVHLIDLRRANNTEIMLTKIKMPLPDMMSAALALDDSVLDADQLENLIKFCPTKEEMELLKNYTGDKETLGKCEQFFLELMKVPRVESKFRIFAFKIQFQSQIRDVRKNLLTVSSACEELRGSEKLKVIMEKILFLGNKLNQGTPRGQALGFRLDSLLKLTDTRANNSRMTLMHFLCKGLADKSPHLLDFYEEFVNLEAASKLQLKALAEEQQAVVKGLQKVEQELAASESDGPVSEVFRKTLKEFTDASGADVRSLSALYAEVGKSADALAYYFGEDPAKCPFEQVTSTLLNFVGLFRKAHEENIKQIEADKKKAQKEAEKEANQDRTPVKSKDGLVDRSPRSPFK